MQFADDLYRAIFLTAPLTKMDLTLSVHRGLNKGTERKYDGFIVQTIYLSVKVSIDLLALSPVSVLT